MTTPDVHIVGIAGPVHDYPAIIADHCRSVGLSCSVSSFPFAPIYQVRAGDLKPIVEDVAATPRGVYRVYVSGWNEFFLPGADMSLHVSAYRSWFNDARMRIIPYSWTTPHPGSAALIRWDRKPPLRLGFMGNTYATSRVARLASRAPPSLKRLVLSGQYLRHPLTVARAIGAGVPLSYVAAFPRFEALAAVQAQADELGIDLNVIETKGFTGQADAVNRYEQHLARSTYVLCPRGAENYSFRVYEALRFGRVPVIIDTDMVLPVEVPWDQVALRVPYDRLHDLAKIIADDYASHSGAQFRARQQLALETSAMLDSGSWLTGVAQDILRRVESKRRRCAETSYHPSKALDSVSVL